MGTTDTIYGRLLTLADERPDAPFISDELRTLTYR